MEIGKTLWLFAVVSIVLFLVVACGGPQSSPERVARAWITAQLEGNCEKAKSLMAPDKRDLILDRCGSRAYGEYQISAAQIDDVVIRDDRVVFVGRFKTGSGEHDELECMVEKLDGNWFCELCHAPYW